MVARLTGALVRAILIMLLVITPSAILPGTNTDAQQIVALIALCAGVFTFAEYNSNVPSIVEFRDAAPFNRIRFLSLFAMVLTLSAMEADPMAPSSATRFFEAMGAAIGHGLDFPYSPVRLATTMIAKDAAPEEIFALRSAAGTAYLISLLSLAVFVISLKLRGWPAKDQAFNVWINLPTFEPTAGGDVVGRLERDAKLNLALGFLLPFFIPAAISLLPVGFEPVRLTAPQTLIWVTTAWAFLPANLLMRGIAMGRIAAMIRSKRAAASTNATARGSFAAA